METLGFTQLDDMLIEENIALRQTIASLSHFFLDLIQNYNFSTQLETSDEIYNDATYQRNNEFIIFLRANIDDYEVMEDVPYLTRWNLDELCEFQQYIRYMFDHVHNDISLSGSTVTILDNKIQSVIGPYNYNGEMSMTFMLNIWVKVRIAGDISQLRNHGPFSQNY